MQICSIILENDLAESIKAQHKPAIVPAFPLILKRDKAYLPTFIIKIFIAVLFKT